MCFKCEYDAQAPCSKVYMCFVEKWNYYRAGPEGMYQNSEVYTYFRPISEYAIEKLATSTPPLTAIHELLNGKLKKRKG